VTISVRARLLLRRHEAQERVARRVIQDWLWPWGLEQVAEAKNTGKICLLADANLKGRTPDFFADARIAVVRVNNIMKPGTPDDVIFEFARLFNFTILTQDNDFRHRHDLSRSPGIIFFPKVDGYLRKRLYNRAVEQDARKMLAHLHDTRQALCIADYRFHDGVKQVTFAELEMPGGGPRKTVRAFRDYLDLPTERAMAALLDEQRGRYANRFGGKILRRPDIAAMLRQLGLMRYYRPARAEPISAPVILSVPISAAAALALSAPGRALTAPKAPPMPPMQISADQLPLWERKAAAAAQEGKTCVLFDRHIYKELQHKLAASGMHVIPVSDITISRLSGPSVLAMARGKGYALVTSRSDIEVAPENANDAGVYILPDIGGNSRQPPAQREKAFREAQREVVEMLLRPKGQRAPIVRYFDDGTAQAITKITGGTEEQPERQVSQSVYKYVEFAAPHA
jgi:predicted nuclease of predicted toxin-antitoxin system